LNGKEILSWLSPCKHPELAGFEEGEIPEFLRKHELLKVIKARIAKSTTAFSKVINLE